MDINELTLDWLKANPDAAFERLMELELEQATRPAPETGQAYFIEASTGCSCCRNENRTFGPYRSLDRARSMARSLHDRKYLASQYALNGLYYLCTADYEKLPGGRLIIGETRITDGFVDDDDNYNSGIDEHPDSLGFYLKHLGERIGEPCNTY